MSPNNVGILLLSQTPATFAGKAYNASQCMLDLTMDFLLLMIFVTKFILSDIHMQDHCIRDNLVPTKIWANLSVIRFTYPQLPCHPLMSPRNTKWEVKGNLGNKLL